MKYIVEVVRFENQEVVKRIECSSEQKADRVEMGVMRQMDLDNFFTRIVEEEENE